jgi:hypothetical protein
MDSKDSFEELLRKKFLKFLNIENIKNFFLSNSSKLSLESISSALSSEITSSSPFLLTPPAISSFSSLPPFLLFPFYKVLNLSFENSFLNSFKIHFSTSLICSHSSCGYISTSFSPSTSLLPSIPSQTQSCV